MCDDCLAEIRDPRARRYRYPFTNCTQCGPRYTLIGALPYDRANTAMAAFPLCPECRYEYEDSPDRRFHAQPLACPACGPQLHYHGPEGSVDDSGSALAACIGALREGRIVALRGVGGYHLLCNARDARAVGRLRLRKERPDKPLAVLFPLDGPDGLAGVRRRLNFRWQKARVCGLSTGSRCCSTAAFRPRIAPAVFTVRWRRLSGVAPSLSAKNTTIRQWG